MKKTLNTAFTVFFILTAVFLSACAENENEKNTAIPEEKTTKNFKDRSGQTVEDLAALFDDSALNCSVDPILNIETFTQEYLDSYILGVDISSIIEVEKAGGKFYDNDRYRVGDVMELLSWYGINWVRIRLWNDPYTANGEPYGAGTNCIEKAIEIGKRAKKWNMKILLNYHYSDFWAHPDQQARPKAWLHLETAEEVAEELKEYTRETLIRMYNEGAMPDMVQIGNETLGGIAGIRDDSASRANEKIVFRAGLEAVREISAEYNYPIQTMLHVTNGMSTTSWWFGVMKDLDFDVIGLSFYPMWHGRRVAFQAGLRNLATIYKKPICILEYSASYTPQGGSPNGSNMYGGSNADTITFTDSGEDRTIIAQAQVVRNMNNDIMNSTFIDGVRYGIGAFWWEPAWLPLNGTGWVFAAASEWYQMDLPGKTTSTRTYNNGTVTWANQAFFSFTGTALPSLNAFLQMMGKPPREP